MESLGASKSFVVSKEESISKGVRRIYGLTGLRAQQAIAGVFALPSPFTCCTRWTTTYTGVPLVATARLVGC